MSDEIWRIRLIGQDKRLSISKCRVRTRIRHHKLSQLDRSHVDARKLAHSVQK